MKETNENENRTLKIPHEMMVECTKEALKNFRQEIKDAKRKFGARYNRNNIFEICMRNFPMDDEEKVFQEYELIFRKQSRQPSSVRQVIRQIGDIARREALIRYMKQENLEFKDGKFVKKQCDA